MSRDQDAADQFGHRELRELLGALVLGQLDDAERLRVQAHLDGCADCRHELAEIAPLAELLRQADPDAVTSPAPEPPVRLARVVREQIHRERREQRRSAYLRRGMAVAASVVLLAGAGFVGYTVGRPDPAPVVPKELVAVSSAQPAVTARADLIAHTWGIEIQLTATGLAAGQRYRMQVVGVDGAIYSAGGLVGVGAKTMRCNLNADVLRNQVRSFALTDDAGRTVLQAQI